MKQWLLIVLMLMAAKVLPGQTREYTLVASMEGALNIGNDELTNIWGFGLYDSEQQHQFIPLPSPTLEAEEGDTVVVHLLNVSHEGHTIHWHGLDVDQANDGVPMTNNFVLDSFTYRFVAPAAGNYLYHCHVTTTLHLSMGMYGAFIVRPKGSGKRIYTGGPSYTREYPLLTSDLDRTWNDDYTLAGLLNDYHPTHFLVNGRSGLRIPFADELEIQGQAGDTVLLRLMHIGYTAVEYIFPATLNATIHTSDGRPLPQPEQLYTLMLYPGERYSVLLHFKNENAGYLKLNYRSLYRNQWLGQNMLRINTSEHPIGMAEKEQQVLQAVPNPARESVRVQGLAQPLNRLELVNLQGQIVRETTESTIDLRQLPAGLYFIRCHTASGIKALRVVVR